MATSSYWNKLYKEKKALVKKLEDQIKELKTIRSNIEDNLWDEIEGVNGKIEDLKTDLNKGVRYNYKFTSYASQLGTEKEIAAPSDTLLKSSINELNEEISRLNTKKDSAVKDRDYYYRQYTSAKDKEHEDRLAALADLFT